MYMYMYMYIANMILKVLNFLHENLFVRLKQKGEIEKLE